MGSTDVRYARRHPFRYAGFFWPHLIVAAALVVNGLAISAPIFDVTIAHGFWPPGMYVVAVLVLGSAARPLSHRVQAGAGAALFSLAVFRIIAYLQTIAAGTVPERFDPVVWSFIAHWVLAAVVAVLWPRVSELSALRATTAAGRERGTDGVA